MASDWINHVKKVSKEKEIPYGEALKVAKFSYKKHITVKTKSKSKSKKHKKHKRKSSKRRRHR